MVKLKITRTDGTVIEAEGTAEELAKLQLIPWQFNLNAYPINLLTCTGTLPEWYLDTDGVWKQKK